MRTEIIAVGTELLTPYFADTNSLFLTGGLNDMGFAVSFKTVVGDEENDLRRALKTALGRSRLVLVTGGLGPTEDDRTRETAAALLGRKLVFDRTILAHIRARWARRGLPVTRTNLKQCYVPEGGEVLENPNGTAPGLWIEAGGKIVVLLPGPPSELRPMFENQVRPRLSPFATGRVVRRILKLTGIGESLMESRIKKLYEEIPAGIGLTTLASPGDLSIHITYQGKGSDAEAASEIDAVEKKLASRLGRWIYSRDGENLETVIGKLLTARRETIACAESCTGGLIGHRLTNVPGSSDYFLESSVVYSNRSKARRLGVPMALIEAHGAVSAPVARAMAAGVRRTSGADYALGVTGIAGPSGGTPRKPVGLVYIALAYSKGTVVVRNLFWGGREQVKFLSSQKALDMLRKLLTKRGRLGLEWSLTKK